jgi:hypothetical protein
LTLFVGPAWDDSLPDRGSRSAPLTLERVDAIAARALGLAPDGSLLARPDGHPVVLSNDPANNREPTLYTWQSA